MDAKGLFRPLPVPKGLLKNARALRRDSTSVEQVLWFCLKRRQLGGWKFRRQHPVGRYVLDLYCAEARLSVEVDGGQHNEAAEAVHDEARTAVLRQHGIEVVRFWNNEVSENLEGVLLRILEALEGRARIVYGRCPPP